MRVVIVGNCQSTILEQLIGQKCPEAEILPTPSVHHLKESDAEEFGRTLSASDVILTQPISDGFEIPWCATQSIRRSFDKKVKVFSNLYFSGYEPTAGFLFLDGAILEGPIGGNHLFPVLDAYRRGLPQAIALDMWEELSADRLELPVRSLQELERRDQECDVKMADFVKAKLNSNFLFHTVNHPTSFLMNELAERILDFLCLPSNGFTPEKEYFDDITVAVHPRVRQHHYMEFEQGRRSCGIVRDTSDFTNRKCEYDEYSLVNAMYELYENVGMKSRSDFDFRLFN